MEILMKNIKFNISGAAAWVFAGLMPVLGYLIFETTTGNLLSIGFRRVLINLVFYYLIYALVFVCCNRIRAACAGTSVVLYLIAAVDYYVVQFKGNPLLLPQDLFAWKTAAAVVSNYKITPAKPVVLGAVLLLAVLFLISRLQLKKLSWKGRGVFAGTWLVLCLAWLIAFYRYDVKLPLADIDDDIFWWSLSGSYEDFGYATSTAILIKSSVFEKPEGYSVAAVEQQEEKIAYERKPVSEVTPENIIMIMNESLADMRVIRDFETNEEFFPFISSLEDNTIKSELYVQVFGGGTSNTEYEVLTGNSMSFLPYVISAYQAYSRENEYGLASTLKSQGYTTVAMHPNLSGNWNRKTVYGYMGFDEFISSSGYQDAERLRNYVSDRGDYERLIQRYEEKQEGEKLFVFNVTMQNHGGYEEAFPEFQEEIQAVGDLAGYAQTDRYLSLMKESDDAFAYLLDYFSQVDEPTMIVMFGDHQASIETEFYEKLYGSSLKDLTAQEADLQYITPLVIWTNYDMEEKQMEKISANYLGSMILELANLELTPYNEFLLSAWEQIPALGKNGYYGADGSYTPWSSKTAEPDVLQTYRELEYNYVADHRHRVDSLFTLEGEQE
jgi:phosphoglycerol transferase MdoB-like AlkP superfamily enzyme